MESVANQFNISRESLRTYLSKAKKAGLISEARLVRPADVTISRALRVRLSPYASRRGIHPSVLAERILNTVLDDKMVDAVLDDLPAA